MNEQFEIIVKELTHESHESSNVMKKEPCFKLKDIIDIYKEIDNSEIKEKISNFILQILQQLTEAPSKQQYQSNQQLNGEEQLIETCLQYVKKTTRLPNNQTVKN